MPVSGFVYATAGGYGVNLFGVYSLPQVLPVWRSLAITSQWVHIVCGWTLVVVLAGHIGLVLRHQLLLKDRLLARMLPSRAKPRTTP